MNVFEAAMKRLEYIFKNHEYVLVSFSGGKDSGVLLNLAYKYASENNMLDKLLMYHIDYEAQYQFTTDYVTETFSDFPDIKKKFWCCVPIGAKCACSFTQKGIWIPWQESKKDIWVRQKPISPFIYTEKDIDFPFEEGMTDYEFQNKFCRSIAERYKCKLAVLVGIRADESLTRWYATMKEDKKNTYKDIQYSTVIYKNVINYYPIYDWHVKDIWVANAKFNWKYNKIYDLYYQAGVKLDEMRVASPFHDYGINKLHLYKVIDPDNWARMVGRVDGVNFAGLYGNTTAMGWHEIQLPNGYNWKSYSEFLLSTLPLEHQLHYKEILKKSIKFWKEKGGVLLEKQIDPLIKDVYFSSIIECKRINAEKQLVKFKEYPDTVDFPFFASYPSYKRFCVCILKNDYFCKYMGFGFTKEALNKRKDALEKYRGL